VHPTLGSLRQSQAVFYALLFFQLDGFAVPAPARVTQTVGPFNKIDIAIREQTLMIFYRMRFVFALSLMFTFGGCVPQSEIPIPSETASSTAPIPIEKLITDTPHSTITPTIKQVFPVTPTSLPESTPSSVWWFPIPEITHPEALNSSTARSYKELRIPPLPAELINEFDTGMPYGEVPPETIFYQLFLIRKGNTRMLWLGIPFKETTGCCGSETPYRIYDSIPFPAIEGDNLLIPFICMRNNEPDLFLIVVAEPPEKGAAVTNIRYAWRIDQASTSLKSVSIQGIECSLDY
jgi:hypothetical protein